jgi:SHS2 domain-containing protein
LSTTRYTLPVPFEELDHTGDAAVRVRGRTEEEALARLVLAFAELVTAGAPAHVVSTRTIEVEPADRAAVAVDVLRELLFELETHRLVPQACSVERFEPEVGARVVVELGRYEPELHGEGLVLKAVTWHEAHFEREEGALAEPWWAQIVFDV